MRRRVRALRRGVSTNGKPSTTRERLATRGPAGIDIRFQPVATHHKSEGPPESGPSVTSISAVTRFSVTTGSESLPNLRHQLDKLLVPPIPANRAPSRDVCLT